MMNYLWRPWKMYSRTVVMESYIGDLIQPVGWLEWNGRLGWTRCITGSLGIMGRVRIRVGGCSGQGLV
ncbi:Probable pectinesterase/pectinesterase inhibitor 25 [Linum perenne]